MFSKKTHILIFDSYEFLDQHATPEILRTPLHELALLIKLLRLGSVNQFLMKAMQPPPIDAVIEAEFTLRDMMAFDQNDELTPLGCILARLPMEPRLGRMVIYASIFEMGGVGAILAATASLGLDVFLFPPERSRLTYDQRKYDAGLHSDHLTALNVFQVWSHNKMWFGEHAIENICIEKQFNNATLRMIEDAANQIRTILISIGFPEPALSDSAINFGDMHSIRCDQLRFILTLGLYPNICYHSDKRKLLTMEGKFALCNKGSVNCPSVTPIQFNHPYFCYGEKIRTQAVSCKNLTMISPLDMMIGGCRQAIWRSSNSAVPNQGVLYLDDWIPIETNFETASLVLTLRPALEAMLVRICADPSEIASFSKQDAALLNLIKELVTDCVYEGEIGDRFQHAQKSRFEGGGLAPPSRRFPADYTKPLLRGRKKGDENHEDWEISVVRSLPRSNSGYVRCEPSAEISADTVIYNSEEEPILSDDQTTSSFPQNNVSRYPLDYDISLNEPNNVQPSQYPPSTYRPSPPYHMPHQTQPWTRGYGYHENTFPFQSGFYRSSPNYGYRAYSVNHTRFRPRSWNHKSRFY